MSRERWVVLYLAVLFMLVGCSRTILPENSGAAVEMQLQDDLLALEQYKPGIPVVVAAKLSDKVLADAIANANLMVIQNHVFSDGSVFEYASIGNRVVSGDMILSTLDEFKKYLQSVDARRSAGESTLTPQGAFYKVVDTWPNGEIVFEIPSLNVYNDTQKTQIQNAMQEITNQTNVGFKGTYNTTSGARIRFTNPTSGCSAHVGRTGGLQNVNLADACFNNGLSTIFHELGHAAGLMHEHQRDDRGDKIVPSPYLTEKGRTQIATTIAAGTRTAYDYTSNMHYQRYTTDSSFTTRTSEPLFSTPGYSGTVRSNWITSGDIATYNLHYR